MGGYDVIIRLDVTFFDGPVNAASYSPVLATWLIPSAERQEDCWMKCGCSTMGHPHTSLFLCAMFRTFSRPLNWPWLTDINRHHCHGRHVVLTLHQTIRCGVLSRGRLAARRYNNNEDLRRPVEEAFRTVTPKMLPKYVGRSSCKVSLIFFSGMEADRNVKVVGGDVAVL